jgi:hypothetical protein
MRGLRAWKWNPREDSNPNLGRFKAGLNALREDIKWSSTSESNQHSRIFNPLFYR